MIQLQKKKERIKKIQTAQNGLKNQHKKRIQNQRPSQLVQTIHHQ
jgi:hypothetical protein